MTDAQPLTPRERLYRHVSRRASRLADDYQRDVPRATATLARMRNGIGRDIGADLALLTDTVAGLHSEDERLPEGPTRQERAAYAALTLFALHQQSQRAMSMHVPDRSMGRAVRELAAARDAEASVRARFTALATASSWEGTVHHARGLIQQLRAANIPLDYGKFAVDLWQLQNPERAASVRLAWGRAYYGPIPAEQTSDADSTE